MAPQDGWAVGGGTASTQFLAVQTARCLTSKLSWLELQKVKRKAGRPLKCSYVAGLPNKTFETNAFARSCLSLSL